MSIALDYINKDSSENYIFFSRDMVDEVNRGSIIENEIRDMQRYLFCKPVLPEMALKLLISANKDI